MSERGQTIMIWWTWIFMAIYGYCLWGLLYMMPPPPVTMTPVEVAAFYTEHSFQIRLGAVITSWTSAFMVPISIVIATQMERLEQGKKPVWSRLQYAGGILMSMFLAFPPIIWGTAAFTVERAPELTTLLHELGTLTLVTTDQFFIFQMIPMAYVCLTQKPAPHSAFPRWYAYFTIWAAIMFEVGALAFMFKTGPFAWNGLFVFWFPVTIFGGWVTVTSYIMLRAIKKQAESA